jgi:hypothetical protein
MRCLLRSQTLSARDCLWLRSFSVDQEVSSGVVRSFLADVAKTKVPDHFESMVELMKLQGKKLVDPWKRKDMVPFVIPLHRLDDSSGMLGYMRWPTQKDTMDLQLIRTNEVGVSLVALTTEQYCKRLVAEMDFWGSPDTSEAVSILSKSKILYEIGSFEPFTKLKMKNEALNKNNSRRLMLDRYLITKVGPFPDCFERIAEHFILSGDVVSGLVTAERATSVFYSWGHAINFQTNLLLRIGRTAEAVESAKAALSCPKMTLASTKKVLYCLLIISCCIIY